MELSALVDSALGPNFTPMSLDDLAHRGQTHAGSLKVVVAVQSLEDTKEPVCEAHVKPGAIVADREGTWRLRAAFEVNGSGGCFAGVLPGVAQEVFQHHPQQRGVTLAEHAWLDMDQDVTIRRLPAEIVNDVVGQLR